MEGMKVNSIINYLDKYSTQIFVLQLGLLVIVFAVFMWVWIYNRKKYNHLKHQIPASVVKNYLDSIIQNSTALKSSLFRGGGLDVDPSSIPSVMPLSDLPGETAVGIAPVGGGDDSALRAEVARLQAEVSQKQNTITELENKNTELEGIVKAKQERIEELEALLAQAQEGGGAPAVDTSAIEKERDDAVEQLKQYEIISDDIANMKRLQQENAQLKAALEAGGGAAAEVAAAPAEAPTPEPTPEPAAAPELAPVDEEPPAPEPEVAAAPPAAESDDKSPEDLLSEFEKMLG